MFHRASNGTHMLDGRQGQKFESTWGEGGLSNLGAARFRLPPSFVPFGLDTEFSGPLFDIRAVQGLSSSPQDGGYVVDLPLRLRQLGPFQLGNDNVLRAAHKKRNALQGDGDAAPELLPAEGPGFADDEINLPAGRTVHYVEH